MVHSRLACTVHWPGAADGWLDDVTVGVGDGALDGLDEALTEGAEEAATTSIAIFWESPQDFLPAS